MRTIYLGICCSTALLLTACDPTFESTTQQCEAILPTTQAIQNYTLEANPTSGYKFYMEDFLNSLKSVIAVRDDGDGGTIEDATLTDDEQAVIDFIFSKSDEYLSYTRDGQGNISSSDNPLDFIESIFFTDDDSKKVLTFTEAKEALINAINIDDAVCNYRNEQIVFQQEDSSDPSNIQIENKSFTLLSLSYIPTVFVDEEDLALDQSFRITFDTDPDNDDTDSQTTFTGNNRYLPPDRFEQDGFITPNSRILSISKEDSFQAFNFSDRFDNSFDDSKLEASLQLTELDERCKDEDNNDVECDEGTTVRAPKHANCLGSEVTDPINNNTLEFSDESNHIIEHHFSVTDASDTRLKDLKRFRVELDYETGELRVYASKFTSAIFKHLDENNEAIDWNNADLSQDLIQNYTSCEYTSVSFDKYTALDDETEKPDFTDGISPVPYFDPGFDVSYRLDNYGQLNPYNTTDDADAIAADSELEGQSFPIADPTPIMTFKLDQVVSRDSVRE